MSKPIQEQIYKSRLTITYRTNITGTVQQEKLPYRLLLLGEFSGRASRRAGLLPDLAKRGVRSIKRGTTVDDHLGEVAPTWRVPAGAEFDALRSDLPGRVSLDKVMCAIPAGSIDRNESKGYRLSGTARFTSLVADNGMADISGDLLVGGSLEVTIEDGVATAGKATLELSGALSGVHIDPATGKPAGVVTGHVQRTVVVDAGATMQPRDELEGGDPAAADPKTRDFVITFDAAKDVSAERTIPFCSMDAFTPDVVAMSLPEVHRLRVLKQLLLSLQSGLRNRPELRKQVKNLLPGYGESKEKAAEALTSFNELRDWAIESFPLLKIERGAGK